MDDRNISLCRLHTTEHSHSEEKLETGGQKDCDFKTLTVFYLFILLFFH